MGKRPRSGRPSQLKSQPCPSVRRPPFEPSRSRYLWRRKLTSATLQRKVYGPDPAFNPQLAAAIAIAKKASVPKQNIERAIAHGQGKTVDGTALDQLMFEAIMPPSVALIIDVETSNKARALAEIRALIKKASGTSSPAKFFFTRAGRVMLSTGDTGLDPDSIMDDAIEAGAEDLESDGDGNIVIWTQPTETAHVARAISEKLGLQILSSDIVWSPNKDTEARVNSSDELENLIGLLSAIRDEENVRGVYSNVSRGNVTDDEWERLTENLDLHI